MDKQIRRLGYALVALFLLLFVQVNYLQVFAADRIANNPANTTRLLIQAADIDRGNILARDGSTILAESLPTRGEFKSATAAFQRLTKDPKHPLISNANDQLYPPGSTFKLVTASAALEDGVDPNATIWNNPGSALSLPQTSHTLSNFGGEVCPGG